MANIALEPQVELHRQQSPVISASAAARQRMIEYEHGGLIRADWLDMVFIHLEVDPASLQRHVPFELDLYADRAFVSLVAFVMRRFRPRGSGAIGSLLCAPLARHGFLNVRTYVRHNDEPGIFFLTEWVSNPLSVLFGPRTYGLPYRWGRLQYAHDAENRRWNGTVETPDRSAALDYRAVSRVNASAHMAHAGSLDEFLLERYTAYTHRRGVNRRFRIRHEPWKATDLDAEVVRDDLLGLIEPNMRDALVAGAHASPGVRDVWIGLPQRC